MNQLDIPDDPWNEMLTFSFVEQKELADGFWGSIKRVVFRNGVEAFMVDIWIAPPDAEDNYGTSSWQVYRTVEEARAELSQELKTARSRGLRSTREGGKVGQPIYFRFDHTGEAG